MFNDPVGPPSSVPDIATDQERSLLAKDSSHFLDGKFHGILICYDRLLDNTDVAMKEFDAATGEMIRANRRKWEWKEKEQ